MLGESTLEQLGSYEVHITLAEVKPDQVLFKFVQVSASFVRDPAVVQVVEHTPESITVAR